MGSKLTTSGATNSGVPNKIWRRIGFHPASSIVPNTRCICATSPLSYLKFLHGLKPPGQTEVNYLDPVSRLGQTQDVLGLQINKYTFATRQRNQYFLLQVGWCFCEVGCCLYLKVEVNNLLPVYVADTFQDLLGEDTAGLRQHPVVCVFLGATPSSTTLLGHILLSYLLRKHKFILYHSVEQFSTANIFCDQAHFTLGVVIGFKQLTFLNLM